MTTEVEAKFLADGPEPLRRLAAAARLGRAVLGPPTTFDEVDRYLDTDDGHLEAAGWASRLRDRGSSTRISLKGPPDAASDGWIHHRPEVEATAADGLDPRGWPPSEARTLLERLSDGRPLRERFRLVQRRTERRVELDGATFGTLSLDAVTVRRDERDAGTLFAVELELEDGAAASTIESLAELGSLLAARPGLRPDRWTKLQHALAMFES